MWFNVCKIWFFVTFTSGYGVIKSDAITNANFNSNIRDYSNDISNITNVKTLQKEDSGRYASFAPVGNTNIIKFKEIPDSALSSSSHSRGLLYHDHPGYTINDYDDAPHYAYGTDYRGQNPHLDGHEPHSFEHGYHEYDPHHFPVHHYEHGPHHYDHGHYKLQKHALGAKTVLLPIAGLALLGAAAALVSNPILLQLGVVSGKRRRRDTEEITEPDFPAYPLKKYVKEIQSNKNGVSIKTDSTRVFKMEDKDAFVFHNKNFKRRMLSTNNNLNINSSIGLRKMRTSSVKTNVDQIKQIPVQFNNNNDDEKFVPIPIMLRIPNNDEH